MTPALKNPGPLSNLRIVELGGIGPGPFCGMLLGDLGADVIRIDRPDEAGKRSRHPVLHRNRRSIVLDLKDSDDLGKVLALVDSADALIEGFRPGVTERLGVGPDVCLESNPRLVYGRMTGWGQDGPLASEPGHDLNYIALSGVLGSMGPAADVPPVPLNLVGDMGGGGMLLALGITSALLAAKATGRGQVVDAAMIDGSAIQMALIHGLRARDRWVDERGVNVFDGGAPFYRNYSCADKRFVSVGCVEPQFYAVTLQVLGLDDDPLFAAQNDQSRWPEMTERLTQIFATRTRDEWDEAFDGRGACVAPVLSIAEAADHPHNATRGTFSTFEGDYVQPAPAPRFHGTPSAQPRPSPLIGAHTDEVLAELDQTASVLA
ncbi:CaiB/BaiF CoA-transferase family protein [Rhodococcus sp. ARC_M6]|uniref:CaiB/BaiF CoA transferase family protein n=1 Tax=Rhodococcus sp. ARC_M6 TaxID=2928852 RepID=UPI001FB1F814|nr:CaiB/BaiF CoA-transferase family protein [Rhodococcus sp. ARC_M6]MCJ0907493.1 CoA transferase [Rhodococcus sp. ARC_M6]